MRRRRKEAEVAVDHGVNAIHSLSVLASAFQNWEMDRLTWS